MNHIFIRVKKLAMSLFCVCLTVSAIYGAAVTAYAASETDLPAGILIGDQDGIHVDEHGYYYIDVRDLQPGDVITKTITIQNLSHDDRTPEGKVPYTLTMRAEPLFSRGPIDLLEKTKLELKLNGKVIYSGPCRGDGTPNMINTALRLGNYEAGDLRVLEVTLRADQDMALFEEKSEADFRWIFYAHRALNEDPPKTGLLDNIGFLIPAGGVLLLSAILIPLKKRRDRRMAEQADSTV